MAQFLKGKNLGCNNLRVVRVYMGWRGVGVPRGRVRMGGRAAGPYTAPRYPTYT